MNNRRDAYLGEMEASLRALPPSEREKEMMEVTPHLDALIAAGERNGQTEAEATESAIAQFGAVRAIGGSLARAGNSLKYPFWDTVLFCAAFSALLGLTSLAFSLLCRSLPFSTAAKAFGTAGFLPIAWPVGLIALIIIALRYGRSGLLQKAFHRASPVRAALLWLFIVFLLDVVLPNVTAFLFGVPVAVPVVGSAGHASSIIVPLATFSFTSSWYVQGLGLLYYAARLLTAGLAAYFVGRAANARGNAANTVQIAAAVGPVLGLTQMLLQFAQPLPGHTAPTPFLHNISGYLTGFALYGVYGIARVFVVRASVQWGEKARLSQPFTKRVA